MGEAGEKAIAALRRAVSNAFRLNGSVGAPFVNVEVPKAAASSQMPFGLMVLWGETLCFTECVAICQVSQMPFGLMVLWGFLYTTKGTGETSRSQMPFGLMVLWGRQNP